MAAAALAGSHAHLILLAGEVSFADGWTDNSTREGMARAQRQRLLASGTKCHQGLPLLSLSPTLRSRGQGASTVVALRGLQSCDTAPSVLAGPWPGRLVGATTRKMPPAPCHRTQAPSLPPASCHPAQPRSCCCPAPASRTQLHVPSRACCRWDAGCGVGGLQADTGRGHPLPVLPADCSGDTATPVPCSPAGQVRSPPKPAEVPLLSRGVGAGGRGRMRCGLPVPAGMGRDPHRPDRASSASGEGEQRTRTIRLTWQFLDLR